MIRDPYQVLGVSRGADMDEIKRAYRRRAKECHPDLHPEDLKAHEKMQQVNEAYDMLCNPEKYASQRQAEPNPGRGERAYGGYAGANRQYQSANWQYAWYDAGASGSDGWDGARSDRRQTPVYTVNPFRGVLRFFGGMLLLRLFFSLLRFGLFGWFF